ncbi:MAG: carboxypeptidase-like regulatory domain-containing protein [Muribaculaceae bacterium]|nr:carboxypeptidase-like regulatory domain-containing protein [Muribaculaceae bacterium]
MRAVKAIRYILTVVFGILFTGLSVNGQTVKVRGKITDENNEPLEFVSIRVEGTALGTMSGLDGDYAISIPKNDTIRIKFTYVGYDDVTRRLIDADSDVTLNVKMTPKAEMLQGVEVTDYQRRMGAIESIRKDDYRIAPDISGNAVESMISTMAGVTSSNEMSSQYSVRGGTFDENSVYINGVEVYRPQLITSGQQEGLSIINPDMVDAIGFSTGGFPAQYADKMSSVLDITYREPESFEGAVNLSLQGGGLTIGTSSTKFSQLHGVRYKSNASLLSSMEERGEYDPRYFDYQTFMTLKFAPKWKASILGNISINDYRFIPRDRTTNFGTSTDAKQFKVYFDGQEKDRFETYFGSLHLTYNPHRGAEYTLLASGYLTNELVTYDISGEYWLDQAGTDGSAGNGGAIGGELGVGKYLEHARNRLKARVFSVALRGANGISGHNIAYGASLNFESIHDRSREWEMRDSAGYSLPFDDNQLKVIYNLDSQHDVSTVRMAAYAQDTYRLQTSAGYLSINGGLRFSYWGYNREFLVSPRFNFGFVPDKAPRWSFRFATGLYYQSPFYKEYRMPSLDPEGNTVIVLNDAIKSPRSIQFILGADYTFRAFNRPFKLSGEAYYKILGNLIPYEIENLKVVYTGQNTSKGSTMGLDLKLYGQFVEGSDSWLSFSLMNTRQLLNDKWVPLPTDRRYALALYFTDYFPKFPKLKFSLRGIFNDGLPVVAPRSSRDKGYFRAPAYKRVDIGLSYGLVTPRAEGEPQRAGWLRHIKSAWIGLDCFNLLDISNVSSYYWVTDVNNIQYAVPNYLTRRQINVRLTVDF